MKEQKEGEVGKEEPKRKKTLRIGVSMKINPELLVRRQSKLARFEDYYEQGQMLGQGGFGKVYKVVHKQTSRGVV